MHATNVTATCSRWNMKPGDSIVFHNEKLALETKFISYNSGILFLEYVNSTLNYGQQITILRGCFEHGSNLKHVLWKYGILNHNNLSNGPIGILMSSSYLPILVSKYDLKS